MGDARGKNFFERKNCMACMEIISGYNGRFGGKQIVVKTKEFETVVSFKNQQIEQ